MLGLTSLPAIQFAQTNSLRSELLLFLIICLCAPVVSNEYEYGTCGGCHCIVSGANGTCPVDERPQTEFSAETISAFRSLELTNPYTIHCNPFNDTSCETTPPQVNHTELGEEAFCGIKYDKTSLNDSNLCPTRYELKTYTCRCAVETDGAVLTHNGACGLCSTTQDLAAYMEHRDLQEYGQKFTTEAVNGNYTGAIAGYMSLGFTEPCARIWVDGGINTAVDCATICFNFVTKDKPNNGPPPSCTLDECLQCDEDNSGPLFKKFAARTRRSSGLLSMIVRPCEVISNVEHPEPCSVELKEGSDNPHACCKPAPPTSACPTEGLSSIIMPTILLLLFYHCGRA